MLKNKWLRRMMLFTIIMLYTGIVVYICSIPRYTKLKGWVTPSSGIVFKTDGYTSFYNGQILDFGNGELVSVNFEKIKEGNVVE